MENEAGPCGLKILENPYLSRLLVKRTAGGHLGRKWVRIRTLYRNYKLRCADLKPSNERWLQPEVVLVINGSRQHGLKIAATFSHCQFWSPGHNPQPALRMCARTLHFQYLDLLGTIAPLGSHNLLQLITLTQTYRIIAIGGKCLSGCLSHGTEFMWSTTIGQLIVIDRCSHKRIPNPNATVIGQSAR